MKGARQSKPTTQYSAGYDAEIAANPPRIGWRRKRNGIWVHTSINDPHREARVEARLERERAAEQAERLRAHVLELMQDEADEVAERFRAHRADNTPLMAAARTEI